MYLNNIEREFYFSSYLLTRKLEINLYIVVLPRCYIYLHFNIMESSEINVLLFYFFLDSLIVSLILR